GLLTLGPLPLGILARAPALIAPLLTSALILTPLVVTPLGFAGAAAVLAPLLAFTRAALVCGGAFGRCGRRRLAGAALFRRALRGAPALPLRGLPRGVTVGLDRFDQLPLTQAGGAFQPHLTRDRLEFGASHRRERLSAGPVR